MRLKRIVWTGVFFCDFVALTALATQPLDIQVIAERRLVSTTEAGQTVRFVKAQQVRVGEPVFFTLRVRNVGSEPIDSAVIEHSLPRNTRYIPGSAAGPAADISFSVDGGISYGELRDLNVNVAIGVMRQAEAADCTNIRWQLRHPLMPGATALLRFRAEFR